MTVRDVPTIAVPVGLITASALTHLVAGFGGVMLLLVTVMWFAILRLMWHWPLFGMRARGGGD
jgi:hypothetical protein